MKKFTKRQLEVLALLKTEAPTEDKPYRPMYYDNLIAVKLVRMGVVGYSRDEHYNDQFWFISDNPKDIRRKELTLPPYYLYIALRKDIHHPNGEDRNFVVVKCNYDRKWKGMLPHLKKVGIRPRDIITSFGTDDVPEDFYNRTKYLKVDCTKPLTKSK